MSPSLGPTYAVFLFGMGFTCMMYGITCVQSLFYFRTYAKLDAWWLKIMTISIWILNTVHTALVIHLAYFYLIDAAINPGLLSVNIWSLPTCIFVMDLISAPVYGFYTWRLWILSKGNHGLCFAVAFCDIGALVTITDFFIEEMLLKKNTIQEMKATNSSAAIPLLVAGGFAAAMDMLVTTSMFRILAQNRTGHRRTDSVINLLIAYTVNTGIIATLDILSAIATQFIWPKTFMCLFFIIMLPSFHTNAYLGSLNGRRFFNKIGEDAEEEASVNLSSLNFTVLVPQSRHTRVD